MSEIVTSKDNLLIRCRETIQELHVEIDKEKYSPDICDCPARKQKATLSKGLSDTSSELETAKKKLGEREEKIEELQKENRNLADELGLCRDQVQQLTTKVRELRVNAGASMDEVEFKSAVVANTEQDRRELRKNNEYHFTCWMPTCVESC